jgi:hypothetical protein
MKLLSPDGGAGTGNSTQVPAGGNAPEVEVESTEEGAASEQDTTTDGETTESAESTTIEEKQTQDQAKARELLFHDPNNLPEELKPAFRRMQASFTKKMHSLAGVAKKAQAFDELARLPQFQKFMEDMNGVQPQNRFRRREERTDEPDAVDTRMREIVKEELTPLQQEREQEKLTEEWNGFTTKYPFFDNFRPELREHLANNPNHTFEQALAIVSFPELIELLGDRIGTSISAKKKGNITKPTRGSNINKTTTVVPKTIEEAFALAKQQHANGKA